MNATVVLRGTIEPDLLDLTAEAIREHEMVGKCATGMIKHAIAAGKALAAARSQLPASVIWWDWLAANSPISRQMATIYQRLAYYEEIVHDAPSIQVAVKMLVGYPDHKPRGGKGAIRATWHDAARKMRADGATYSQIATVFGVTKRTAITICASPERRAELRQKQIDWLKAKRQRQRLERDALKRQERDKASRRVGGGFQEAYSLIRRTAQVLDGLEANGASPEIRKAASQAIFYLYRCEDKICEAMKQVTS